MKMPASFAEFSDALQKARIKDGSFCKNELTCIHYNGLTHAMIGWNANLYDLNLFAQRLASLTEEQKKGMDALLKIKQNHRVAPIPLNQLINLTYNTDICCFAPRVSNHEELGAFLYANEMLSNEAMALLDTTEEGSGFQERLLELLGEQHQEDHGGVFTDFGYAELGGEIKDIYVCQSNETACFHRSDAPVMLEVRKGFFNDPSYDNDKTAVLTTYLDQPATAKQEQRTLAVQISDDMFQRLKSYLDAHAPLTQKALVQSLLNQALDQWEHGEEPLQSAVLQDNKKERTLAIAMPESLFHRVEQYVEAHNGVSKRVFVVGLVAQELQSWLMEQSPDEVQDQEFGPDQDEQGFGMSMTM